jgi:transcriptional regulator with XRE-family HTH domain
MNSDELYCALGLLIAEHRKRARMTQQSLAVALGLSRASVANIERGKQGVLLHVIFKIASILNLSVLELIPSAHQGLGSYSLQVTDWLDRISSGDARSVLSKQSQSR